MFFGVEHKDCLHLFFIWVTFLLYRRLRWFGWWNIRHHMYEKPAGVKSIDIKEVGPRFELRLYQVIHQLYYSLIFILLQNFSVISKAFYAFVETRCDLDSYVCFLHVLACRCLFDLAWVRMVLFKHVSTQKIYGCVLLVHDRSLYWLCRKSAVTLLIQMFFSATGKTWDNGSIWSSKWMGDTALHELEQKTSCALTF